MRLLAAAVVGLLLPHGAFAVGSDQCGQSGWCNCGRTVEEARCMGSYATCEEACGLNRGGGSSGGGFTPSQQAVLDATQMAMPAIQQGVHNLLYGDPQREAAKRAEDAARAERARLKAEEDARNKEEAKRRLMTEMIGVEPSAHTGGLELMADGEASGQDRGCACAEAMAENDAALKKARSESAAFPKTLITMDFKYGIGEAKTENWGEGIEGESPSYVFEDKNKFGHSIQLRDSKTSFDDLVADRYEHSFGAAAGEGIPPARGLLEASGLARKAGKSFKENGENIGKATEAVDDHLEWRDWWRAMKHFHEDTEKCVRQGGASAVFTRCLEAVNGAYKAVFLALKDSPVAASANRVEVAKDAYQDYVKGVLSRSEKAMRDSRCAGACR